MEDIRLSDNFTFLELTITEHRRYLSLNRQEGLNFIDKAYTLTKTLFQPIRDYFKQPLIVHSGFRCAKLNKAIGGSPRSQHCLFEACDFHIVGIDLDSVFKWIWTDSKLKFGQLILEGWSVGHPSWIHISLCGNRPLEKCQMVMTYDGDKYIRLA